MYEVVKNSVDDRTGKIIKEWEPWYELGIRTNFKFTEEDLYNDMITIQSRINKPIIYQGHINFYFDNYEPLKHKNYVINERQIIDNAILKYNQNKSIIYKNVFKNYNWRNILISENDLNHLNTLGMDILKEYFEKYIL